jgi:double-stranded uracil-DNA glycosylase
LVSVKVGLPPVARKDARRYYAHRTNQFWRLLGLAIGEDLQPLDYDSRLTRLAQRSVGLWDVIASASRPGSLDHAIRESEHNRIEHLLCDFPDLRAVAFNGSTAAAAGRKLIGDAPRGIELIDLPSSSAANTKPFDQKAKAWSVLGQFIQP